MNPNEKIEFHTVRGKMVKICKTCIYDENTPSIKFDENGVCNYCHMIDDLKKQYKTGTDDGINTFMDIIAMIKKDGDGKKYD